MRGTQVAQQGTKTTMLADPPKFQFTDRERHMPGIWMHRRSVPRLVVDQELLIQPRAQVASRLVVVAAG